MAGTFTSELTKEGLRPWAVIRVAGWGRRINAAAVPDRRQAYRWSTLNPSDHGYSNSNADSFIPALRIPPDILEERIDLRSGRTDLGQLTFDLLDVPGPTRNTDHGWLTSDVVTDLLATERQVDTTNGPWSLTTTVNTTATTWQLADVTGISADDVLWIEAECVIVSAVNGGLNQLTVVRAAYQTEAQAHSTRATGGEGLIYDHPTFVKGRQVELFLGLFDSRLSRLNATHEALAVGQLRRLGYWRIDDWELSDHNAFRFVCRPSMGRLDRAVGRKQFVTTQNINRSEFQNSENPLHPRQSELENDTIQKMLDDEELVIVLPVPKSIGGEIPVPRPQYTFTGAGAARYQEFHARWGDQLVEARYYLAADSDPIHGAYRLQAYGLRPGKLPTIADGPQLFCDVLITHPRPRRTGSAGPQFFTLSGTATSHPVDIILCLVTSTGLATNGDWDSLPEQWGVGYPQAQVNFESFRRIKQREGGLRMTGLVLGWEGRPIPLRPWIEQHILSPMGWYLYLDENGLLALGIVSDLYTTDLPTITETDLVDIVQGSPAPPAAIEGGLDETLGWHTWRHSPSGVTGTDFRATVRYRPPEANRYPDELGESQFDLPFINTEDAPGLVAARMHIIAARWHTPLPRIRLLVGLHRLELVITDGILLTVTTLPNPFTGTRGFTSQPAIIVGRRINLARGVIELEVMLVTSRNVGLWAPAGTVSAYAVGPPVVVTFETNDHSDADAAGQVPIRDVLAFAVDDNVMLLDGDLQVKAVNTPQITDIENVGDGNDTCRLDGAFSVAAAVGDTMVYCHYAGGAGFPQAAWSSDMQDHVAQADDADVSERLPNDDPGYVYGG